MPLLTFSAKIATKDGQLLLPLASDHAGWCSVPAQLGFANCAGVDVALTELLSTDCILLYSKGKINARRSTYLPQHQWQILYSDYQNGASYASLALQFGISKRAVQYGIHDEKVRRGLPTRIKDKTPSPNF